MKILGSSFFSGWSRLDRAGALGFLGINLALLITIAIGDRSRPQVENFSWHHQKIGQSDRSFTLTFDRLVAPTTVAKNLTIDPPMAGAITWQGRQMRYHLTEPPQYGQQAKLTVQKVTAQNPSNRKAIIPFQGEFNTRDQALIYVGLEDDERGRLVLKNLTTKTTQILTPEDLTVTDFKVVKNGQQIIFSAFAFDPTSENLYMVNTGLGFQETGDENLAPGRLFNLLMDGDYIQSRFVASDDGRRLVIYRQSRKDPDEAQLWAQIDGGAWQPLGLDTQNFKLSPDGTTIAFIEMRG
ncbi:MAG: hypothetical protein HC796_07745 [Synechococcaceae cyanobacterium RL_1_2]|nr:hypothetical protein [Synechococcaceae cyanobacterium RL_1_2]